MAEIGTRIQVVDHQGSVGIKPGTRGVIVRLESEASGPSGAVYAAQGEDGRPFLLIEGDDKWVECIVRDSHG